MRTFHQQLLSRINSTLHRNLTPTITSVIKKQHKRNKLCSFYFKKNALNAFVGTSKNNHKGKSVRFSNPCGDIFYTLPPTPHSHICRSTWMHTQLSITLETSDNTESHQAEVMVHAHTAKSIKSADTINTSLVLHTHTHSRTLQAERRAVNG